MIQSFSYSPLERVYCDHKLEEIIPLEIESMNINKIFIVTSSTLSKKTKEIEKIKDILGSKLVGIFDRCKEHSPIENVLECAKEVKKANPDIILTIGGGTPIDTVKVVQLCITLDIDSAEELKKISGNMQNITSNIRQIAVPTTLSGGEYSVVGGAMDTKKKLKQGYFGSDICPKVVILDPYISVHTPEWLWLSTAIRSVDHAVEGFCSISKNPMISHNAIEALRIFSNSLRKTKKDLNNIEARSQSQKAVWIVAKNMGNVMMGASHGIGYLLGSLGSVPHGQTSCVMLPAVLKWNEDHHPEKDKMIASALGRPNLKAYEAVKELIVDLGLPSKLSDVGIGSELYDKIVEYALEHQIVLSNPKPITKADDVYQILDFAEKG
tara:strand:+ start:84 stop:1226 length:1143 start_codon:yes stop_codon:yes gene_type:complete